jgi:hemerythrin-like domain-containing protein
MCARRAVAAFEGAPLFLLVVLISRAITLESRSFLVLRVQTTAELGALSSGQNQLGFMSTIQKWCATKLNVYADGETAGCRSKKEETMTYMQNRRHVLRMAFSALSLTVAEGALITVSKSAHAKSPREDEEAEVTPGEDLMQEHGVLERILLVYDEAIRRIEHDESFDVSVVAGAAAIVRRFVENYHEKLEEQFVFPRLQAANREVDLVAALLRQHERGRHVTDEIVRRAKGPAASELAQHLRDFNRMYRPHAAREDTVLFPAFRKVVGRKGYRELGEQFEDREHELFGKEGFETVVRQVADLERSLGIYDLAKFTPA